MSIGIIVPITRMAGKLDFLESWLRDSAYYDDIFVYLVHDKQDQDTGPELNALLKSIKSINIRLIESSSGNPGRARNLGIAAADDEHIVFWDSDDLGNLSELRAAIAENKNAEIIICNYVLHDLQNNIDIIVDHKQSLASIVESPGIWRFIFKSQVLDGIFFKDYSMGEDQLFLEQIGFAERSVVFSHKYVYQYNTNRIGSLTYHKNVTDLESVVKEGLELAKNQHGLSKNFTRKMVFRQSLTIIRHGKIFSKLKSIFMIIQVLLI